MDRMIDIAREDSRASRTPVSVQSKENSKWRGDCMAKVKSGKYWVSWADTNAPNSKNVNDLTEPFKSHVAAFIDALEAAGAKVDVQATRRHPKRAYLFHWSWLIALGKVQPRDAGPMVGVDIEWDHGKSIESRAGAKEMVSGFGLAVPPKSSVAPALSSHHIAGKAIDMVITWDGNLAVKKKDGTTASVPYMEHVNGNVKLHEVGQSYGVKKHRTDAPHWSVDGH